MVLFAFRCCTLVVVGLAALINLAACEEVKSFVTVPYWYELEVNETEETPTLQSAISILENETISTLADILDDSEVVQISWIDSTVDGICSSLSEQCVQMESNLTVSLGPNVEESVIELATLEEIKSFLEMFNGRYSSIRVDLLGPFVVQADMSIRLRDVSRIMNSREIVVLQETLVDVLNPLAEGVLVTNAFVYLQNLRSSSQRRHLQGREVNQTYTNEVSITVRGSCLGCSSDWFDALVEDAVEDRSDELGSTLGENGSTNGTDYFRDTSVAITEINEPFMEVDGVQNFTVRSFKPFPYWILAFLGGFVLVITTGFCFLGANAKRGRQAYLERERQKYLESRDRDKARGDRRRTQVSPSVAESSVGHSDVTRAR